MRAKIPSELAVPCHECAHGIACLAFGSTFKCIRLRDEAREIPSWAQTLGATAATSHGQFIPTDERIYRDGALTEAKVLLAGPAFEKLRRPWKTYFEITLNECATDWDLANRSASALPNRRISFHFSRTRRRVSRIALWYVRETSACTSADFSPLALPGFPVT